MKNYEFYKKYKTRYPRVEKLSRGHWWSIVLISIGAVLIEPLIVYKSLRHIPFTRAYYLEQIKYFLMIGIPLFLLQYWATWRESVKRNRGYCWIGKFEVVRKHTSLLFYYLELSPGKKNKLKVKRSLFNKIREGDIVVIRRDALGKIERIMKMKNFAERLSRIRRNAMHTKSYTFQH